VVSFAEEPCVSYQFSRLCFKASVIERLGDDEPFQVITPVGTFRFTKGEFYRDFPNVVASSSYRDTAMLMRRIVDAFGEYERLVIRARTRHALKAKRAQGLRAGNVPFGFSLAEDRKALVANPEEQQTLAEIRRLRQEGCSMPQIAARLNDQGLATRSGSDWRFEYIRRLLRTA